MFGLMILAFVLLPVFELNDEWIWLLRPINFVLLVGVYRYSPVNRLKIYAIIAVYIIISILGERRAEFLYLALTFGILFIDKLSAIGLRKALIQYIILVFTQ